MPGMRHAATTLLLALPLAARSGDGGRRGAARPLLVRRRRHHPQPDQRGLRVRHPGPRRGHHPGRSTSSTRTGRQSRTPGRPTRG